MNNLENTILQTANLLKRIDLYEQDIKEKLDWIKKEIKNPTPQADMSLDEKLIRLQKNKETCQETLHYLSKEREKLKSALNDTEAGGIIYQTAETFNHLFK